ncbi:MULTISPECIES: type II toxin-antitoxin system VapC family toxin [Rhizobium]|uniref:type II toxin-antitoxin system VapC family toxin n=1 Tax=Rhizobium TaxID=379 RepID=UPI001B32F397|nr:MULTISPECIES: type II toxin-antitoxin system VapC family toxin [Rhizobium]MBX4906538.1 type II toxin-antitoxin system VapC family toxin [Rhizobium bangladeshense]MBX5252046.1 type II toxin-antitoxin system VapC family toxin [Rhizobium sp. NLR4b]MBX5255117.1 type II toxin-antitoxin system VapC family toxin [Rhizobium sp. NLR16b]MBX5261211.1 type II toxin-antitoxin system VapC family toxin [Rhizobium sp. NLR16a]MBX5309777.1 type II toxin-antitoxin system VapC family toxin [Rhizobium sp. NLR11
MILADTSIWIDHFRHADPELRKIIEDDRLLCHPAVIGELALGSLRNRGSVIAFLAAQREVAVATHDEVMVMIDRHNIFSMGIGYTDAHLLASVLLDRRAALWTRDKRLQGAAGKAGVSLYTPVDRRS